MPNWKVYNIINANESKELVISYALDTGINRVESLTYRGNHF